MNSAPLRIKTNLNFYCIPGSKICSLISLCLLHIALSEVDFAHYLFHIALSEVDFAH